MDIPVAGNLFFILTIKTANYAAISLVLAMSYILTLSSDQIFVLRYFSSIVATIIIANLIITINNNLQRELLKQSISDPLTQCYNRRHMVTTFEQVTNLYPRAPTPVSMLLIDIDYFKKLMTSLVI